MNFIKKIADFSVRWIDFPLPVVPEFHFCKFDAFSVADIGQTTELTVTFRKEIPEMFPAEEIVGFLWAGYTWRIQKAADGRFRWELRNNRSKDREALFSMTDASNPHELDLWFDSKKITAGMVMEAFGHPFQYYFYNKGNLIFHSCLIEYDGKGILMAAPSGTGKTTFSRTFRDTADALVLCGDRGYCVQEPEGWMAYGAPWCGTSGEYVNRKVPVKAVLVLRQAEENRLEQLRGMDAWSALYENLFSVAYDERMMQRGLDSMESFLEKVPVYRLYCTLGTEPVQIVMEELSRW